MTRRHRLDEARHHLERSQQQLQDDALPTAQHLEDVYGRNGFAQAVDLSLRGQPPPRRRGPKPT
jgi:hypothetical protein